MARGDIKTQTKTIEWVTTSSVAYIEIMRLPLVDVEKGRHTVTWTAEAAVPDDGRGFFRVRATASGCWWLESALAGGFAPNKSREERVAEILMGITELYHTMQNQGLVEVTPNDAALVFEARSERGKRLTIRECSMTLIEG